MSILEPGLPDYGLLMHFDRGDLCDGERAYELTVQLNCDAYGSSQKIWTDGEAFLDDPCRPYLILNTPAACPVITLAPLWLWVDD